MYERINKIVKRFFFLSGQQRKADSGGNYGRYEQSLWYTSSA